MANPEWKAEYGSAWERNRRGRKESRPRAQGTVLSQHRFAPGQHRHKPSSSTWPKSRSRTASACPAITTRSSNRCASSCFSPAPIYRDMEIARMTGALELDLQEDGPERSVPENRARTARLPQEAASGTGERHEARRSGGSQAADRRRRSRGRRVHRSDDRAGAQARSDAPRARSNGCRTTSRAWSSAPAKQLGKARFAVYGETHLSGCDVHAAALLRPSEGLSR